MSFHDMVYLHKELTLKLVAVLSFIIRIMIFCKWLAISIHISLPYSIKIIKVLFSVIIYILVQIEDSTFWHSLLFTWSFICIFFAKWVYILAYFFSLSHLQIEIYCFCYFHLMLLTKIIITNWINWNLENRYLNLYI